MYKLKANGACMSGSGSAVLVCLKRKNAIKCVEKLKETYPQTFLCKPIKSGCSIITE